MYIDQNLKGTYCIGFVGYKIEEEKKVYQNGKCRKLMPIEYERLQTLPDNYTYGLSGSKRYSACGNGWTVDVIAHILKNITQQND